MCLIEIEREIKVRKKSFTISFNTSNVVTGFEEVHDLVFSILFVFMLHLTIFVSLAIRKLIALFLFLGNLL